MIIEKQCSCGFKIRENGEYNFKDSAKAHFKNFHTEEWKLMKNIEDDAQRKFEELRKEYQELSFGFSMFQIDLKKLLEKKDLR